MLSSVVDHHSDEPFARWKSEAAADPSILNERIRFPYACNMITANRLVKTGMNEELASYDRSNIHNSGIATKELANLYEKFGEGGFGLIVSGAINVNEDMEVPGVVIIDKDLDSESRKKAMEEWTGRTKKNGAFFVAQLLHTTTMDVNKMRRKNINEMVEKYAYAAYYAQQRGFDGVEIKIAVPFALASFLSKKINHRTDENGGVFENRSRPLFRIMQLIRGRVYHPTKFIIGLDIDLTGMENAFEDDEAAQFFTLAQKTGFDYIVLRGGNCAELIGVKELDKKVLKKKENFFLNMILIAKQSLTRTKLFLNNGFVTVQDMVAAVEGALTSGIGIDLAAAAEPDLANKILTGRVEGVVKSCISPADIDLARNFAAKQLWQHSCNMKVMDASNPEHVNNFKLDAEAHNSGDRKINEGEELVTVSPTNAASHQYLEGDKVEALTEINERAAEPRGETTSEVVQNIDQQETIPYNYTDFSTTEGDHHVVKKQLDDSLITSEYEIYETEKTTSVHKTPEGELVTKTETHKVEELPLDESERMEMRVTTAGSQDAVPSSDSDLWHDDDAFNDKSNVTHSEIVPQHDISDAASEKHENAFHVTREITEIHDGYETKTITTVEQEPTKPVEKEVPTTKESEPPKEREKSFIGGFMGKMKSVFGGEKEKEDSQLDKGVQKQYETATEKTTVIEQTDVLTKDQEVLGYSPDKRTDDVNEESVFGKDHSSLPPLFGSSAPVPHPDAEISRSHEVEEEPIRHEYVSASTESQVLRDQDGIITVTKSVAYRNSAHPEMNYDEVDFKTSQQQQQWVTDFDEEAIEKQVHSVTNTALSDALHSSDLVPEVEYREEKASDHGTASGTSPSPGDEIPKSDVMMTSTYYGNDDGAPLNPAAGGEHNLEITENEKQVLVEAHEQEPISVQITSPQGYDRTQKSYESPDSEYHDPMMGTADVDDVVKIEKQSEAEVPKLDEAELGKPGEVQHEFTNEVADNEPAILETNAEGAEKATPLAIYEKTSAQYASSPTENESCDLSQTSPHREMTDENLAHFDQELGYEQPASHLSDESESTIAQYEKSTAEMAAISSESSTAAGMEGSVAQPSEMRSLDSGPNEAHLVDSELIHDESAPVANKSDYYDHTDDFNALNVESSKMQEVTHTSDLSDGDIRLDSQVNYKQSESSSPEYDDKSGGRAEIKVTGTNVDYSTLDSHDEYLPAYEDAMVYSETVVSDSVPTGISYDDLKNAVSASHGSSLPVNDLKDEKSFIESAQSPTSLNISAVPHPTDSTLEEVSYDSHLQDIAITQSLPEFPSKDVSYVAAFEKTSAESAALSAYQALNGENDETPEHIMSDTTLGKTGDPALSSELSMKPNGSDLRTESDLSSDDKLREKGEEQLSPAAITTDTGNSTGSVTVTTITREIKSNGIEVGDSSDVIGENNNKHDSSSHEEWEEATELLHETVKADEPKRDNFDFEFIH